MKQIPSAIFVFIFLTFSTAAFAQSPTQTQPNDTDVVKIFTSLIQIDVIVTDKKGTLVTDLKPDYFEILENGEKQNITNFSYIQLAPYNSVSENPRKSNNTDKVPAPPGSDWC